MIKSLVYRWLRRHSLFPVDRGYYNELCGELLAAKERILLQKGTIKSMAHQLIEQEKQIAELEKEWALMENERNNALHELEKIKGEGEIFA